ncbi:phosphoribosylanthranilate isomerase [Kineosporia sp. J2-2]|uniref:N-(5'-phosphoribosyl)anthranilate isomerase n=1 Tax=Kineosporia corallincola TaxID=2835133 RepID=A0ABS5TKI4_9ACTN|nr:phosphoribosylanthranilate isomerase [Kineosporia corallincola]MBT0771591.1 phosphoribosylanthranilate isomerase [Kineosporia corallincola]
MTAVFVKICGVRDLETARVAAGAGADAIGFVHHPASPRHIEPADARPIVEALGGVETVLVVRRLPLDRVLAVAHASGVSTVQFHGGEPDDDLRRALDEGFRVIRALSLAEYLAAPPSSTMDARLLLDAPDPGQGRLIDAGQFTRRPERPWILAGGLTPDNVRAQIEHLHPDGVDVSSGVESARGVKDHAKIVRFIENARAAV